MKLSSCDVTPCNDFTRQGEVGGCTRDRGRWVGAPGTGGGGRVGGWAGQGEVGGCTRRVQTAWLSLDSALKMPWLALSGPLLFSYAQTG